MIRCSGLICCGAMYTQPETSVQIRSCYSVRPSNRMRAQGRNEDVFGVATRVVASV